MRLSKRYGLLVVVAAGILAASAGPTGPAAASPSFPGPGNTGVPSGTSLRVVNGRMTVTNAGAVVSGIDLHGELVIKAPNVTVKNSIIRGARATKMTCIIQAKSPSATNLKVTNVEITPQYPSVLQGSGICGGNFTLSRDDIHGAVDGVHVQGSNVTVQDSYIHDEHYYSSDPSQGGNPSHCDGIQVLGGRNVHLIHNTVLGGNNAAVQVTQNVGAVSGLDMRNNLFDYGTYPVKLNNAPLSSMSGITIASNYFGAHAAKKPWAIIAKKAVHYSATGNVWLNSGSPAYATS